MLDKLEQRLEELSTLNAVGDILNAEGDFSVAVEQALERLVDLLDLKAGWVFLTRVSQGDSHRGSFRVAAVTGLPPALSRDNAAPLCSGLCDCQWLFKQGKLDKGVNIVHCSRLEAEAEDKDGLGASRQYAALGAARSGGHSQPRRNGRGALDADTLAFLTTVGRQLGTAFERSKLQTEREREARYAATLEERQRLATEMHDSVAQLLFGAELSLKVAQEGRGEQRERSLVRSSELVSSALGELRGLVEVLRPADLSQGLPSALSRLAQRTQETGVRVHLETEPLTFSDAHAEALYRAAQEALHNALRHAGADNIWIRLLRVGQEVKLSIEDDGRGLDEVEYGLGLRSIKARAESLSGRLELTSSEGLHLEVTLPHG